MYDLSSPPQRAGDPVSFENLQVGKMYKYYRWIKKDNGLRAHETPVTIDSKTESNKCVIIRLADKNDGFTGSLSSMFNTKKLCFNDVKPTFWLYDDYSSGIENPSGGKKKRKTRRKKSKTSKKSRNNRKY